MITLKYNAEDGSKWANFSGDRNPIHFDLAAAQEINQPALVVHGMRVLLDINDHLLPLLEAPAGIQDRVFHLTARFQAPLLCDVDYQLLTQQREKNHTFKIVHPETNKIFIRGYIGHAHFSLAGDYLLSKTIPHELQSEARSQWPNEISANYIQFLSALMFRELFFIPDLLPAYFFCQHSTLNTLANLLSQAVVLQTHHEIYFDSSLLSRKESDMAGISLGFEHPTIINSSDGWLCQIAVIAKEHGDIIMQISTTIKVNSKQERL